MKFERKIAFLLFDVVSGNANRMRMPSEKSELSVVDIGGGCLLFKLLELNLFDVSGWIFSFLLYLLLCFFGFSFTFDLLYLGRYFLRMY